MLIGEASDADEPAGAVQAKPCALLETNLDDVSGELIGLLLRTC